MREATLVHMFFFSPHVHIKFFQNELQNQFTKKWICDFISYPIFIQFSKDHAYFLTHRKMYNLCSNSWIFTPKTVKKTKNPVADDKNCKIFSKNVQEPNTLNSNQDTWFTTKPNPLSLTQSENYSFWASFDKILSNINKI